MLTHSEMRLGGSPSIKRTKRLVYQCFYVLSAVKEPLALIQLNVASVCVCACVRAVRARACVSVVCSLSVCLFLFLCLTLSLSLSVCLCLSVSVCLCLSVCLSLPLPLPLSPSLCGQVLNHESHYPDIIIK